MRTQLIELARNPAFVPHVYDYCDQWCRYCPATARCLVFAAEQLRHAERAGRPPSTVEEAVAEAIEFTRAIAEATGTSVAELDVLLSDPSRAPGKPALGDPLEQLGRRYAHEASRFLLSSGVNVWEQPRGPEATPLMVVAWFHIMIAAKIYRALTSADRASRDEPALADDANGSAKLVLIAVERSRTALRQIAAEDDDARIGRLTGLLDMLAGAVEKRFPGARAFVRPGLDASGPA